MYILNNGITEIKDKSFIKKMFCKHEFISGEHCSSQGLTSISGENRLTICKHCGKIKEKIYIKY